MAADPDDVPDQVAWRSAPTGSAVGLRILDQIFGFLPVRSAQYLILGLIWGWFQHYNRPRASLVRAMRRIAPGSPYWSAWRAYLSFGFTLVERHYLKRGRLRPVLERSGDFGTGSDTLLQAVAQDGPLCIFASHSGSAQMMELALGELARPVRAVALKDAGAGRLLTGVGDIGETFGGEGTIVVDGSIGAGLRMLKALRAGDVLCFMSDRPLPGARREDLLEVPFFGEPALFPLGPAKLACTAKSAVIAVSVFRVGRGRYGLLADPIDASHRQPERVLQDFVAIQERHLRACPSQWFNFFPFWPADVGPVMGLPVTVPVGLRATLAGIAASLLVLLPAALMGLGSGVAGAAVLAAASILGGLEATRMLRSLTPRPRPRPGAAG